MSEFKVIVVTSVVMKKKFRQNAWKER